VECACYQVMRHWKCVRNLEVSQIVSSVLTYDYPLGLKVCSCSSLKITVVSYDDTCSLNFFSSRCRLRRGTIETPHSTGARTSIICGFLCEAHRKNKSNSTEREAKNSTVNVVRGVFERSCIGFNRRTREGLAHNRYERVVYEHLASQPIRSHD